EFLHNYPLGIIQFLLPRVASISQIEILNLREEYSHTFTSFQHEIVKFLKDSNAIDSESKLVDLLRKIDNEVHRLSVEFEAIDKKKKYEKFGLLTSFSIMSFILVVPPDLYRSVVALFGASGILQSLRNIRFLNIEQEKLSEDPFFIPYKLTTLSKQCQ
ncbi:MAG: hypothetical protein ACKPCM_19655, partial [Pseudanabaena sp.]